MSSEATSVNVPVESNLQPRVRPLARVVFTTFLLTFIASRILVILIMGRMIPDLFLHMGQTHVHHLNYGIFLLCAVAGLLVFFQVNDRERWWCAVAYGFGLALTFDEFGMWLHLGGGYWQRGQLRRGHRGGEPLWDDRLCPSVGTHAGASLDHGCFRRPGDGFVLRDAFQTLSFAGKKLGPRFQQLEETGPQ